MAHHACRGGGDRCGSALWRACARLLAVTSVQDCQQRAGLMTDTPSIGAAASETCTPELCLTTAPQVSVQGPVHTTAGTGHRCSGRGSPCMPPAPMEPDTICPCAMGGAGAPSPCMWCAGAAPGTAGSGGRGAPAPAWGAAGRGRGAPGWPAWPGAPCNVANGGVSLANGGAGTRQRHTNRAAVGSCHSAKKGPHKASGVGKPLRVSNCCAWLVTPWVMSGRAGSRPAHHRRAARRLKLLYHASASVRATLDGGPLVCTGTGLAPLTAEAGSAVCSPGEASGQQWAGGLQQRWQVAPERRRVLGALALEVLQRQAAPALQRPARAQRGRPRGPEHGREPAVQSHLGCQGVILVSDNCQALQACRCFINMTCMSLDDVARAQGSCSRPDASPQISQGAGFSLRGCGAAQMSCTSHKGGSQPASRLL